MKNRIFVLLVFFPIMLQAQITQVTKEQKQEALQHVTNFCNLLSQWSNGQRMLDAKIYALCSGSDCSAYDDITTNKETTLRNYLLGIQKKYPNRLTMQLSQPSISNCDIIYEPELTISSQVGSLNGDMDPHSFTDIFTLHTLSYKNAYLAFKINHTILGHSNNETRVIIYDLNAKKVTAYIAGQGSYVSYLNGLNLMSNGEYRKAIQKFETAMTNRRSSLYKSCNMYAAMCSSYLLDIQSAIRYGKASGDAIMSKVCDAMDFFALKKSFTECLNAINECLQLISRHGNTYKGYYAGLYYLCGVIYSLPNEKGHNYNARKSVDNFKKAIELGHVQSAYTLYNIYLCDDNYDNYLTDEEASYYLEWAAENGHLGAILMEGTVAEYGDPKNINKANEWYIKGANLGDPFCMARLGKNLISSGERKKEGCDWLRKALEGNKLENQLKAYSYLVIQDHWWPKSRSDIQSLLDNTITSTTTYTSSSATSSSNASYQTTSGIFSYGKHHDSFNEAKDDFDGGLSIGYIQKQWVADYDNGETEKMGMFDEKYLQGIQIGYRYDPQFAAGFGINTGLFYEYCWEKSNEGYDGHGKFHYTYEEHGIYLPLHLKFTMNFSKWFQFSLYGGAGANYIFSGNVYLREDGTTYDSSSVLSEDDWRQWNFMIEYGASLRINTIQVDFTMSQGTTNWSDDNTYKIKQGRPLAVSMTFCF